MATPVVLGTFVGTLVVIAGIALWPSTGDTGPVSPPQPTTTIDAETPVEPFTREYRLLDGRIATLTTHSQLTLQAYSFFIHTPDLGGERHVIVAVGDPAHVAEAETAEEEAFLSDTATLWRADREGQPLFLSVDLGQWVVWLSVGNQSNPPGTDALLQLAERLTGTTDERGVTLEDLALDYHELHLSGGPDELVTLRVGTCFNEMVPSGEIREDSRWGSVIRSERRAAWCIAKEELELEVHGPKAFVDGVVDGIDITVGDGVESTEIDDVLVFQHDSLGGDTALHGGVATIRNNCLYVDDAVVVWHESQLSQAQDLITDIKAGARPDVLLGGGGISLDEGDTPIPSVITDLCPTRVAWYSTP